MQSLHPQAAIAAIRLNGSSARVSKTCSFQVAAFLALATVGIAYAASAPTQAKKNSFDDAGARCQKRSDCKSHMCLVSSATDGVGKCSGDAKLIGSYFMLDESKNVIQIAGKK